MAGGDDGKPETRGISRGRWPVRTTDSSAGLNQPRAGGSRKRRGGGHAQVLGADHLCVARSSQRSSWAHDSQRWGHHGAAIRLRALWVHSMGAGAVAMRPALNGPQPPVWRPPWAVLALCLAVWVVLLWGAFG